MTLDEYFKLIVKPTETKEQTMFDVLKAKWTEFWTTRYIFDAPPAPPSKAFLEFKAEIDKAKEELTKPTAFVEEDPTPYEDGHWGFEMYTPEWIDEHGETVKPIHTLFFKPHEGAWMEVLDTVLDAMEEHYGYSIKEQVYYSVNFPLNTLDINGKEFAGYSRCLNDDLLQQVLLAHPELYLSSFQGAPEDLYA